MSDRGCRALRRERTAAATPPGLVLWLALFALFLQIVAAGLCPCGFTAADALADMPHCHVDAGDAAADHGHGGDQAPGHHSDPCPFCTAHCHAPLAMAPAVAAIARTYTRILEPAPCLVVVAEVARFPAGAPPRGPPAA